MAPSAYPRDGWTCRDIEIVAALTVRVRVMTLEQIAAHWWSKSANGAHNARRSLRRLVEAGLLEHYEVDVEPLVVAPTSPIVSWQPENSDAIDAHAISYRLQSRWTASAERKQVFVPTALAAHLFGSFSHGLHAPLQATHDVHLAEVFLYYCRRDPSFCLRWRGESCYRKAGFGLKDPDAFILNELFEPVRVIEFGGKYPAERVAAFHEHCLREGLPYELW